mmetsp:Transcript_14308/g.25495  ORF Transcript_14308/g.25495 Transcript_14308/m.25495 type:complete len:379 (+) Transcript_14308:49-1185(+)
MSLAMHTIALALAYMACSSHGRRMQPSGDSLPSVKPVGEVDDRLNKFASLLLMFQNPSAAWQFNGHEGKPAGSNSHANLARPRAAQPVALKEHAEAKVNRRDALSSAAAAAMLPFLANAAKGPSQSMVGRQAGMTTGEDIQSLQQISPGTFGSLGAGTISSRSRPVTGVILLEEVKESGEKNSPTVTAEMVLDGGVIGNIEFQSQPGFPVNRGMFYDVEVKQQNKDSSAFVHVARLPEGKALADVPDSFFTDNIFSTVGRYGAYGAPSSMTINKKSKKADDLRLLEVSFSTLSPSQREVERRCLISVLQPKGSQNAVMLVAGTSAFTWAQLEPTLRKMASSLKVASVRPTALKRTGKSDYRFEDFGGFNEKRSDGKID